MTQETPTAVELPIQSDENRALINAAQQWEQQKLFTKVDARRKALDIACRKCPNISEVIDEAEKLYQWLIKDLN